MQIITREIKVRPKLTEEEYHIKLDHAIRFFGKNDQVKIFVMFRGREVTHPEAGVRLLLRFAGDLETYATAELPPIMEGRQVVLKFAPK